MDLVKFLLDRFGEDQAVARAATQGAWFLDTWEDESVFLAAGEQNGPERYDREDYSGEFSEPANVEHAVRWQPARVLREVEAKRLLLTLHAPPSYDDTVTPERVIDDGSGFHECQTERGLESFFDKHFCPVMLLLALPYADHPDYDPGWKPQD